MHKGAQISVADIYDTAALDEIFKTGKSIFILNPPAGPMTDTPVPGKKNDCLAGRNVEIFRR
ncbi:MAG: hypothetical protein M3139_07355 [Bacteroidota bacterium]|nr:hypothetical protein [Bacteroidota bacterium]